MLSTSPDGSADKIQVFDFKMNYKLLSPSTISLYTPTFLSIMLHDVLSHLEKKYFWKEMIIKEKVYISVP